MIKEYLGQCGETQLQQFERQFEVELPEDYREFLSQHNGAIPELETRINVSALPYEIDLDSLFGIEVEQEWLDLNYWMNEYSDELPESSVIIGRDLMGGFLVLICEGDSKGVYYWDHELNFDESDEDSNVYFVAGDFAEFLEQITK